MTPTHAKAALNVPRTEGLFRRRWVRNASAVIIVTLFTLWLLADAGGATLTTWIDDLGEFSAAAAAAAACAAASHRAVGRDRLPWALIAASCGAWAAGQLIWSWFELVTNTNPFPSLADVGFLAAIPVMIAGLFSFPRLLRGNAARLQAGVDALIIAIALLVISWSTALGAVYTSGADGAWTLALSLVYPASDIAIITIALVLATRARSTARAPLLLLAAGTAAIAVSDSSLAYATSINAGLTVSLDWGWFAGFVLIALAALEASGKSGPVASRTPLPAVFRSVALYLVVVAAMGIVAWHVLQGDGLDSVLFVSLVTLTLLTAVRQLLAILDSAGSLRKLVRDGLTGLPDRDTLCSGIDKALAAGSIESMVLCIEIDNLAAIKSRLGQEASDLAIEAISRRLDATVHRPDLVANVDADHFGALLLGVVDLDGAIEVARRVQQSVEAPLVLLRRTVSPVTTIGISPVAGFDTGEDVIRGAETAMVAGKAGGGHAVVVFEPLLSDSASALRPHATSTPDRPVLK
jgi:diguanylate cyclase (GGDEF)-like protein